MAVITSIATHGKDQAGLVLKGTTRRGIKKEGFRIQRRDVSEPKDREMAFYDPGCRDD